MLAARKVLKKVVDWAEHWVDSKELAMAVSWDVQLVLRSAAYSAAKKAVK